MFTPSAPVAYLLIMLAAAMFGTQFVFQKRYTSSEGTSVDGALRFSLFTALLQIPIGIVMSAVDGAEGVGFPVAALCAGTALCLILNSYFSVKVFESADMTLYSVFEMLGGMALPFVAGMLFFSEEPRPAKFVAFAMITAAVLLETGKTSPVRGKAIVYYIGLFITNGLVGVCATVNARLIGASTGVYILFCAAWTAVFAALALTFNRLVRSRPLSFKNAKKAMSAIAPYVAVATLGNVLLLTALTVLPASVQYPMSTGGTIVVSCIISLIKKEKLTAKNFIAAAVAVASAIIIIL